MEREDLIVRLHSNLFLNFMWNDMLTLFCLHHPTHWGAYRKSRAQRDFGILQFTIVLVIIFFYESGSEGFLYFL